MNKTNFILLVFILSVLMTACKKEENTPSVALNETVDTAAILKYNGAFLNGPFGSVNGEAGIYQIGLRYNLKLMNFSSSNGPDLRVYLSKEMTAGEFIDLGALKSTAGNQVYDINGTPDFAEFKYALIHCRQYNHLFGWALLQ